MQEKEQLKKLNLELKDLQECKQENAILQKQIMQSQAKVKEYEHLFTKSVEKNKKEQRDVDKLQKMSFANFYHSIKNDKSDQLDKEIREALQAKSQLDLMKIQLKEEQEYLDKLQTRLTPEMEVTQKYNQLLNKKRELVNLLFPQIAMEIENEENEIAKLQLMITEIEEAIIAGKKAEEQVKSVLGSLNSARNWGTYDIIGGGLLATMAKHGHMEETQAKIQKLDALMKRFDDELDDIDFSIVSDLNMANFIGFADWFFDGLFVDLSVQSKIKNAENKVMQVENKIQETILKLNKEKKIVFESKKSKEKKMEEKIRNI